MKNYIYPMHDGTLSQMIQSGPKTRQALANLPTAKLPPRLEEEALDDTYAPLAFFGGVYHKVNGGLTAGFGDSHTAPAELTARRPYWEVAAVLSDQYITRYINAGIAGNTVQQMLSRIDADVISKRPDRVIFLAGTNNIGDPDLTASFSVYRNILDKLTLAGIAVALVSIPPMTTDIQSIKDDINTWNTCVMNEAARRGFPFINIHALLTDGSGNYQPAYTTDNIHMSDAGALITGQAVWSALQNVWPSTTAVKLFTGPDATSLISNPTMVDGNSDGIPDGWGQSGNGTVGALSITTDPAVSGNVLRLTRTAASGVLSAKFPLTGLTPGDTLEFAVKFRSNSNAVTYNFYCTASDTAYALLLNQRVLVDWKYGLDGFHIAYGRITLPPGAVRAELVLQTSAGIGSVDWGQATLRKLGAVSAPSAPIAPPAEDAPVVLVSTTSEPTLVINPLLADANTDNVPDSWLVSGNATKTVGTDSGVVGNAINLTRTDTTTACNVTQDVPSGFAVGDVLELGAKYSLDTAGQVIYIYANCMDSGGGSLLVTRSTNGDAAVTTGYKTGTARFTVPAGTIKIQFRFQSASGTGTVKFAQATLRKKV